MRDIDKIAAFHAIKEYLPEKEQNHLANELNINKDTIEQRLVGFENEIELFLILWFLGSSQHILSFDESTSVLTNSYSSDALVLTKKNKKILLEIKSTKKDTFKISGRNLQKRIDFSNDIGFPLYFAVKISGMWGIWSSNYLMKNSGRLKFEKDFSNSEFTNLFGSVCYLFPEGIKIKSHYSKKCNDGLGIQNEKYGKLFKYQFYFKERLLFEVTLEDNKRLIHSLVLEALHDFMSNQYQTISQVGDVLMIEEKLKTNVFIHDFFLFLVPIRHIMHEFGFMYSPNTFFKKYLEEKSSYLTKELIDAVLTDLKSLGLPVLITKIGKKYRYR